MLRHAKVSLPHIRPFAAALLFFLFTLSACTQPAIPQPSIADGAATQPTQPVTFTVATYNIQNFFDTHDNPYTDDDKTKPKTPAQLDTLAAAIKELNADILILQEVEAGGFLKQFNKEKLADLRYTYAVDTVSEDPRGITVALLSRYPVVRTVSHRFMELVEGVGHRTSNNFARDLTRFDVRIRPGYEIAVFGVHLKSKWNTEGDPQSNAWRLREANRIAVVFDDLQKVKHKSLYLIAGDFNDLPESPATQKVLNATHPPLVDTLAGVEPRITFRNARYKEAIDNIFISPALKSYLVGPAIISDGGVFDDASDHRPVTATFHLP